MLDTGTVQFLDWRNYERDCSLYSAGLLNESARNEERSEDEPQVQSGSGEANGWGGAADGNRIWIGAENTVSASQGVGIGGDLETVRR
jgi:hypothetical protein